MGTQRELASMQDIFYTGPSKQVPFHYQCRLNMTCAETTMLAAQHDTAQLQLHAHTHTHRPIGYWTLFVEESSTICFGFIRLVRWQFPFPGAVAPVLPI